MWVVPSDGVCRAFPIIDQNTARHALYHLFAPVNDHLREKYPEDVQRVLNRAAEFGVYPPEEWS